MEIERNEPFENWGYPANQYISGLSKTFDTNTYSQGFHTAMYERAILSLLITRRTHPTMRRRRLHYQDVESVGCQIGWPAHRSKNGHKDRKTEKRWTIVG